MAPLNDLPAGCRLKHIDAAFDGPPDLPANARCAVCKSADFLDWQHNDLNHDALWACNRPVQGGTCWSEFGGAYTKGCNCEECRNV